MLVLKLMYLSLPVLVAGAVHTVVIKHDFLSFARKPLDGGLRFRGQRIFGANKTWRGAAVTIIVSGLVMLLQQKLGLRRLEFFDYAAISALPNGALLGLGFVIGELPNSFLKRQYGLAPGAQAAGGMRWIFGTLDQLDSVAGCLAAVWLFWHPPCDVLLRAVALGCLWHMGFNLVFVLAGIKRNVF